MEGGKVERLDDAVVFPQGIHRHVVDGVEVTLVVPRDVTAAQLARPLAGIFEKGKEDRDDADAA